MFEELVSWAEIDIDAFTANIQAICCHVGPRVEVMAVIKANAYGHGAVSLAPYALQAGATRLAVHRAIEGVELRRSGVKAPIVILGYTPPAAAGLIVKWNLTPSVITQEFAQALSIQASAGGGTVPIHIKVDTGMSRYGLMPSEVLDFTKVVKNLSNLRIEGIFTHFGTADILDQTHIRTQLGVFNNVLRTLHRAGIEIPVAHAANSATIMRLPEAHFNAVRPGISMYGLKPSVEWDPVFELKPILTIKSRVARISELPEGSAIGYGRTYITQHPTRVVLVIFGYGDGYHRVLSNKGSVLIHGQRAAILGRVSMDQIVVDVTGIPGVQQDDEVVLVGKQGDACISAEEVAQLAGTINYEITTSLLPRVTRVYTRNGVEISRVGLGE